jgi:hypothetical protein
MDRDYYLTLSNLKADVQTHYLRALRDCVYDQSIFQAFRNEVGMGTSLLRDASVRDVEINFPAILRGDGRLTSYKFKFAFATGHLRHLRCRLRPQEAGTQEALEFAVRPGSKPPTNVHVLIGRNGVGKTRLLSGMADALTENKTVAMGIAGRFSFSEDENEFLNIIVVSYSAFDRFDPLDIGGRAPKTSIPYYYIGIKRRADTLLTEALTSDRFALKRSVDFSNEFRSALRTFVDEDTKRERYGGQKYARWKRALDVLRSDPGLAEFADEYFDGAQVPDIDAQGEAFDSLSSGHENSFAHSRPSRRDG